MNYGYLFAEFNYKTVNPDDNNDPVIKEIKKIASENGLTVRFNKVGGDSGGAAVMPPRNQVTINLDRGADRQWRILPILF